MFGEVWYTSPEGIRFTRRSNYDSYYVLLKNYEVKKKVLKMKRMHKWIIHIKINYMHLDNRLIFIRNLALRHLLRTCIENYNYSLLGKQIKNILSNQMLFRIKEITQCSSWSRTTKLDRKVLSEWDVRWPAIEFCVMFTFYHEPCKL